MCIKGNNVIKSRSASHASYARFENLVTFFYHVSKQGVKRHDLITVGTSHRVIEVGKVLNDVIINEFVAIKVFKAYMATFSRPYLVGHIGLYEYAMGILNMGV